MTDPRRASAAGAAEMLADLQRLVEALDRRVPHLERLSEAAIARDAADLRQRAIALMRALEERLEPDEQNVTPSGADHERSAE